MGIPKEKLWYGFLLLAAVIWCLTEAAGEGDFLIFMSASGDLSRGLDVYKIKYLDGYHYYYSVLFAMVLRPFYVLPWFWVKFAWLALNLFLYIRMFMLLASSSILKQLRTKTMRLFLWLVFLFSFRFLRDNIHTFQVTILILACCIYGLVYVRRGKPVTGAALLALGINIKLLPLVFLPWLLYRGHFRAFVFTVLFYLLSLFLPSLFIGHGYNSQLLAAWWQLVNPTNQQHILDTAERSFHSLSTLLSTLLVAEVPDSYALPLKRHIADLPLQTLSHILLSIRAALVLLTMYFLKWPPFRRDKGNEAICMEISYILLLIPLIFPHQQHYAFLFAVPAFAIILFYLLRDWSVLAKTTSRSVSVLLALIYLSANLKILLGEFNHYYEHYKILTYGALLLIPLLIWSSKRAKITLVINQDTL